MNSIKETIVGIQELISDHAGDHLDMSHEYYEAVESENKANVALTKTKTWHADSWLEAIARNEFDGCKNDDQRKSVFYASRETLLAELNVNTVLAEITYGERKLAEARIDESRMIMRIIESQLKATELLIAAKELGEFDTTETN